jgi:hypothetical protein
MNMKYLLTAISLFVLTSCGGGGGGGGAPAGGAPAASNFNGVAVDGYLYQARAFLDLNGNGQYDNGEPTATTDANGAFTLSATQDQINSHSVVVTAIAGTTIDQDNPNTPLTSGMTLVAPAGNPSVVSPLTTQVSAKMAGGLSLAEAKSAVQTELGLSNIDVMKNYVAEKTSNAAYAEAHKVAVSVAVVLKNIESQSSSSTTLSAKLSAAQAKVTEVVVPNLVSIKQASVPTSSSGSSSSGSSSSGSSSSGSSSSGSSSAAEVVTKVIAQEVNIYSIGGTISGLNSSGLVLANGANTLSPSSGSNTFTFSSKKAAGNSYSVTVQSNPAGQICTVSNGSGTVGSQSITNVAISCSNTPGVLGGTISGLTTSGLVLKNGSNELTVTSGSSTFQFNSTVADGATYSVTVKTQPTGKTCTVSSGTGTMVSAGITNVQVTCSANSYSVSGSISGLVTSGLKLKNGSEVVTVSSGATTFVLSNPVAYGGSYAVVVDNQPTGYTCSTSSASGAMGAQNITSVQISCALVSYTLGGTITGLASNGLSISNGAETIAIDANATSFTFVNKVAYGGTYSVSIATQPSNGYTCTITNGSGSAGADNISDVSINCTNRYPLKGQIYSFESSSANLVLTNGSESITVSPGTGQYQFTGLIQYGASYNLTIGSNPDYSCAIAYDSGGQTMTGAQNTVNIRCTKLYSVGGAITGVIPPGVSISIGLGETLSIPTNLTSYTFNTKALPNVDYFPSVFAPDGYVCKFNQQSFSINSISPAAVTNLNLNCQEGYEIVLNDLYSTGSIGYGIKQNGQLNFGYLSPDFAQSLLLSTNIGGVVDSINLTSAGFKTTKVSYGCTASLAGCNNSTSLGVFTSGTTYSITSSHGSCVLAKVATPDTKPTNTHSTTLTGTVSAKVYFDVLCISN